MRRYANRLETVLKIEKECLKEENAFNTFPSIEMDLFPATVTFFGCLFWSLEWGILVGIGTNLLLILHHSARPKVSSDVQQVNNYLMSLNVIKD